MESRFESTASSHDSFESSPVKNNKNFQYRGDGEKESRKGHYLEISYGSNNLRTHWFVHSMIKMHSLVAKH